MMMTGNNCLLDTSIIINTFKDSDTSIRLSKYSEIFIPSIAVGELYFGAYRSSNSPKHIKQINQFLENCIVISVDYETADYYEKIKTALKAKGRPIPENDIWIAAIAVQHNLPLFTADQHFKEIDVLTLV